MVGSVGVADPLIPADLCNPGRRRVEGALRRSQCYFMAVYVQLAADGAGEDFVHTGLFDHGLVETERKERRASSPA
jgi:hypothetical protein